VYTLSPEFNHSKFLEQFTKEINLKNPSYLDVVDKLHRFDFDTYLKNNKKNEHFIFQENEFIKRHAPKKIEIDINNNQISTVDLDINMNKNIVYKQFELLNNKTYKDFAGY
jgi:hypothetical protein